MLNPDTEEDKAIGLEAIVIIVLEGREEYFISISWSLQQKNRNLKGVIQIIIGSKRK